MQKKLLTLAVAGALAAPVAALAQVTVYGTIDGGIRNQSKVVVSPGVTDSRLDVEGGRRTTNRWGLKGSEDLGGGLMANFTLEGTYGLDSSGDTLDGFDRKALVGLSKGGNSVDLGRDYTVNFKANGVMDPMSFTYTGITTTAGPTFTAGTRSDNLITAGFRFGTGGVRVDYAAGEVVGTGAANDRLGFGADFAFGPVTVAAAFSTQETGVNVDTTWTNLGAAYSMGALTFRGGVNMRDVDQGNEDMQWMLGVQYGFSPTLNGRVGYYNWTTDSLAGTEVGSRKVMIVALDYYLSKRTTAYVVFDRQNFEGTQLTGAAGSLADGATGIGVGVAHSF
jgi:predicted porin